MSRQPSRALAISCALVTVILLFSACSDSTPTLVSTDTPEPTTTFVPAVTIFAPTSTPTPVPPTATVVPTPAATATSAVPTALPENVNPFTGLVVSDTALLNRRPLLIKVANTSEVRPQHGLAQADVVVEHYAEGGITRFSALFLTNSPEQVGSVRSCRLIDIELPVIFGSALTCSGTSPGVKPILRSSEYLFDKDSSDPRDGVAIISDFGPYECMSEYGCDLPMFRTADRSMPHNLFANTLNVWKELDERGRNKRSEFHTWTFDGAEVRAGKVVTSVDLPYTSGTVTWDYDVAMGSWARSIRGFPHTDAVTGKPLTASNVLVVYAPHVNTSIQEDTTGSLSIQIQLWGQGPLKVYRDGRVIDGTWQRDFELYSFALSDANGKSIALKPGNTWIQLVPMDFDVKD
ncbi:MAG: DUF3048 domain-containing protein [Chloroflexi bacterium]|nr:DUF3048 domain-containing protein [Chloroflexota bacterium]